MACFRLRGITLIQSLVAASIMLIIAFLVSEIFIFSIRGITIARARTVALGVATEYIELFRNLPYSDIGTINGTVPGVIPQSQSVTRENIDFTIDTEVLFIDDSYDGDALGTIPGKPLDTEPADYKKVEVRVCWSLVPCAEPVRLTTTIVTNGLESQPNTGSLIIHVIDASGLPVSQADVHLENAAEGIDSTHTTDTSGNLALLSLPPSEDSYHITITKSGFSTDSTWPADLANPNPVKQDASVVDGGVTEVTFAIDTVSSLAIRTIDLTCQPVPNIGIQLSGSKLIYHDPDVLKYETTVTTDGSGNWSTSALEWDDYSFSVLTPGWDIAGSNYPFSISVLPSSSIALDLNLVPESGASNTLLVTVKDSTSGSALSGATIHATHPTLGTDMTIVTGQGSWTQSDWSGGSGQAAWSDATRYASDDGNVDVSAAGTMTLAQIASTPFYEEPFSTEDYRDIGNTTAEWDTSGGGEVRLAEDAGTPGTYELTGTAQSTTVNTESGEITAATLTATEATAPGAQDIAYYLASDGVTFEPVTTGSPHTFTITGNDLRWKAVLTTTNPLETPVISNLRIDYTLMQYASSGMLESSTYTVGDGSNVNFISWHLVSQPAAAGENSVQFQVATADADGPWTDDIFLGPDETHATYYTSANDALSDAHTDVRYVRYRVYLSTEDAYVTPLISDMTLTHNAGCLPSGQAFFSPLEYDTYDLSVSLAGYDTYDTAVSVSGDTMIDILLTPTP